MQRKKPQLTAKDRFFLNKKNLAKIVKNRQNGQKLPFLPVFLGFFRNGTLQRAGGFCVAFSGPKPFF